MEAALPREGSFSSQEGRKPRLDWAEWLGIGVSLVGIPTWVAQYAFEPWTSYTLYGAEQLPFLRMRSAS